MLFPFSGWRDATLRGLVALGVAVVLITELLGEFHLLRRTPLALVWCLVVVTAGWAVAQGRPRGVRVAAKTGPSILDWLMLAGIASIGCITLATALRSPPNSSDAMSYHMPRVVYWAQAGGVSFFPTPYYAQIMLQPLAEYFALHTYVLSGSDRFVNLVQWLGSIGCAIGVSLIAKLLGAERRGQIVAALFCATLPNGILQASGAKNDYLLALWLAAMAYFALRYALRNERGDLLGLSASVGLALMTKGTAYVYGPAVLVGIFLPAGPDGRRRLLRAAPVVAAVALLLNGPQYWRNFELSGSPLGFDSAQGDGFFRWRNDTLGWRQTVSNLLRNGSEQLGAARSVAWNRAVYAFVLRSHAWLEIDPNDPATTWRWTAFTPPVSSNHETNANNRWHLLILLAVLGGVAWRRADWLGYLLALPLCFLLVCFYLKWQPFFARMFLPLFVLGAPMAGLAIERLRPVAVHLILGLFLVNNARPYLFENWVRPWKGPNSIWKIARDDRYFSDMNYWHNRDSFLRSVALTQRSGCHLVGIDINRFQLEYPFQALLRERDPDVYFVHTGVDNGSVRYGQPVTPCVILCMDCVGVQDRIDRYRSTGPPIQVDRFLLFIRGSSAAPTAPSGLNQHPTSNIQRPLVSHRKHKNSAVLQFPISNLRRLQF